MKGIIILISIICMLLPFTASALEECSGNFDCDQDVDGTDAFAFKLSFGRSQVLNPCTTESPCNGDFNCDQDCDGTDASKFKSDFGRSTILNSCPVCLMAAWCNYRFRTCGDIYPQDCMTDFCTDPECGDGVLDMLDILEMDDIIQGRQIASACQVSKGDVPNGVPPNCGNPPGTPNCESDGDIDIFDSMVLIDKASGNINCCDYCLCGQRY
jgi:hypothetical protein